MFNIIKFTCIYTKNVTCSRILLISLYYVYINNLYYYYVIELFII